MTDVGQIFGRLAVIAVLDRRGKARDKYVLAQCSCGQQKEIALRHMRSGKIVSCGCFLKERIRATKLTHGQSRCTPEYNTWSKMLNRCRNPNDGSYNRYGGRGISVCSQWHDFKIFFADMGARPSAGHSIERIDNDGNYEPKNCIWATRVAQARNKRNNRVLELNGSRLTLVEWAEILGVHKETLRRRLAKWPVETALTTPAGGMRSIQP